MTAGTPRHDTGTFQSAGTNLTLDKAKTTKI